MKLRDDRRHPVIQIEESMPKANVESAAQTAEGQPEWRLKGGALSLTLHSPSAHFEETMTMTPQEKEVIWQAAARAIDPSDRVKLMLEAWAVLNGKRAPFVVWPTKPGTSEPGRLVCAMTYEERAAWLEAQAAELRVQAMRIATFNQEGFQGDL